MLRNSYSKAAFTLIELLVVISVILVASSIIFLGGNSGDGTKLSSALRIVSGVAQGARGQAILKNAETRIIIYAEQDDPEKYLRYFGIVYWEQDEDSDDESSGGWRAATQGTYLPEGIYFDPELSKNFGSERDSDMGTGIYLDYPRISIGANTSKSSGGGSQAYYQYGYESNGTSSNENEWLTLRAGVLKTNSDGSFEVDFDDVEKEALKAAIIFRRSGSVTLVEDPDYIY
jgi:prepilin-type N-terminal cleavage/methylation domain-containing protein